MHLFVLLAAIALDRIVGDPDRLWRRLPHPVALFGALIGFADRNFNRAGEDANTRRAIGVAVIAVLLAASIIAGAVLSMLFMWLGPAGLFAEIVVVSVFLAQKSLSDHVRAVRDALVAEGLAAARRAVAMIVGRDPETLDRPAVVRASLESLAENFSDGTVAPVFWYAVAGLPGLLAYKMLNTADSMIGHLNEKHRDFGWASARLDDAANWPAARIAAVLIAFGALATGGSAAARRSTRTALRDAGLHRSPNAGWPEAAMAGALDVTLAGPRSYGGVRVMEPCLNASGRQTALAGDIETGLSVYFRACDGLAILVLALGLVAVVA